MKASHFLPVFVPALGLSILMGGCSSTVSHPSLAPRAIERFEAVPSAPSPAQPVTVPADASREARISTLLAQARDGDRRFQDVLAQASAGVERGAGAAAGGEAWVEAQQGLSRIDALRAPVVQALADLDALQLAVADSDIGTAAAASLADAQTIVTDIDARERAAVSALRGRLVQP